MWFLGMFATLLGIMMVLLAVTSGHIHVDSRMRWSLTRGTVVIAIGVALIYGAELRQAHLLPPHAITPLGFSSMLVEILSATTIALFGSSHLNKPMRPRSRPTSVRRGTRLAAVVAKREADRSLERSEPPSSRVTYHTRTTSGRRRLAS
jgi:hypothetical protein